MSDHNGPPGPSSPDATVTWEYGDRDYFVPTSAMQKLSKQPFVLTSEIHPARLPGSWVVLRCVPVASPDGVEVQREVVGIVRKPHSEEGVREVAAALARQQASGGQVDELRGASSPSESFVSRSDLGFTADVARRLKVKPATVSTWVRRHQDFPAPVVADGVHKVWVISEVVAWHEQRNGSTPNALQPSCNPTEKDGAGFRGKERESDLPAAV